MHIDERVFGLAGSYVIMGLSKWRRDSGCYSQCHAENAIFRYKSIIGGRLRAKNDEAQEREAAIGCAILNRMLEMGRPMSYAVG